MPQCQLKDFRELAPHLEKIQSRLLFFPLKPLSFTELPNPPVLKVMVAFRVTFVCVIVKAMEENVHLRELVLVKEM